MYAYTQHIYIYIYIYIYTYMYMLILLICLFVLVLYIYIYVRQSEVQHRVLSCCCFLNLRYQHVQDPINSWPMMRTPMVPQCHRGTPGGQGKYCTLELTKVNIHWKVPLKAHWTIPAEIHERSDNPSADCPSLSILLPPGQPRLIVIVVIIVLEYYYY